MSRNIDVVADSKDEDGRTPLWQAAERGHEAVVKLLLGREHVAADSKDIYGRTPLWWAAQGGHEAVSNSHTHLHWFDSPFYTSVSGNSAFDSSVSNSKQFLVPPVLPQIGTILAWRQVVYDVYAGRTVGTLKC
ncbi:hypothetical protein MMC13_003421 [Lambiella insularis]|nr:hypothetical protein [Lambiella insularis]